MRVLLDTHIFLWVVSADARLRTKSRRLIARAEACSYRPRPFGKSPSVPLKLLTADRALTPYGPGVELLT